MNQAHPAPILEVDDLRIAFASPDGIVRAVDGVSWQLFPGEMLGIVGESGCGKSVTAMSVLRLLPGPPAMYASGAIRFRGENLLDATEARMRELRGNAISMIFQDPMTSLNPVLTIGEQIAEVLMLHQGLGRRAAWTRAAEMLDLVGIPDPQRRVCEYPHQFSGGMRQRAMIALALACSPAVLIADEPTTALDVTIQAQIMDLLDRLRREMGTAIVLITHDLGVVAESCDRVVVMYAGNKVEEAAVDELFARPTHPYTRGLLGAMPDLDTPVEAGRRRLAEIPGMVPSLKQAAVGCRFAPRCAYAEAGCHRTVPALAPLAVGHAVACLRAIDILEGAPA
ncbi:ABC transporter ATP-binding protein [Pseudothauera rhizosphaerae]|uniref:ABC transporter ATP-binding protein n=1 Tax=Pseudothauera rhizosphaerae TaxID=2565932 RepID=A0A4V3WB80_9RHOO|nr:ABC transporter ATP-binding protein [Pseudothauera rhizosphaerae]THF62236.1 ABC transporter ATP-binding protein [Pseudothauera rhizosphaerae]